MQGFFLVFVLTSPLFVNAIYSYENGIVKCPDENINSEFNVTELNNTTFTKVNRTMLNTYKKNPSNYDKFTTSCTTNVTDMKDMFQNKNTFNSSISTWDTSNVEDMSNMFNFATSFNQDISNWTTSSVQNMEGMFYLASSFNSSISNWTTSSVRSMHRMFTYAFSFNQDISKWDTSSVTDMIEMFYDAKKFNSDISKWDTSSVLDMNNMFFGALKFNQSLTNWCVNTSETSKFSNGSPIDSNPAFLPLWNGEGCEYKCFNGGIRNITDTVNYSCICEGGFTGLYCNETITTTLTSTSTSTLTSTLTSTSTSTSSQPDTATDNNRIYLIIGLVLGAGTLLGLALAVYLRCKKVIHAQEFNLLKFELVANQNI